MTMPSKAQPATCLPLTLGVLRRVPGQAERIALPVGQAVRHATGAGADVTLQNRKGVRPGAALKLSLCHTGAARYAETLGIHEIIPATGAGGQPGRRPLGAAILSSADGEYDVFLHRAPLGEQVTFTEPYIRE